MRRITSILCLLVVTLLHVQSALVAQHPVVAISAGEGTPLWQSVQDEVAYRIPALAMTADHTLIALTDDRHTHGRDVGFGLPIDILCRTSSDRGTSWSGARKVADSSDALYEGHCYGFGDAALVADRTSDRQLLLCVGDSAAQGYAARGPLQVYRFYGSANGTRWERGENISGQIYALHPDWQCLFVGSGRIHQSRIVKKGAYYRLYCALLVADYGNAVIYSDDFGATWQLLGDDRSCCQQGDEPKVEELPDGTVILSSRTWGGRYFNLFRFTDHSFTQGTWDNAVLASGIEVIDNSCNGDLLCVPTFDRQSHRSAWLYLQSLPAGPGRSHVSIYYKIFDAESDWSTVTPASFGADWQRFEVTSQPSAYSALTPIDDHRVGILYEHPTTDVGHDLIFRVIDIEYHPRVPANNN